MSSSNLSHRHYLSSASRETTGTTEAVYVIIVGCPKIKTKNSFVNSFFSPMARAYRPIQTWIDPNKRFFHRVNDQFTLIIWKNFIQSTANIPVWFSYGDRFQIAWRSVLKSTEWLMTFWSLIWGDKFLECRQLKGVKIVIVIIIFHLLSFYGQWDHDHNHVVRRSLIRMHLFLHCPY